MAIQPLPATAPSTQKITLVLDLDQIAFLDETSAQVRGSSGAVINRSALIRALVSALRLSGLGCTQITSGKQLAQVLAFRLNSKADLR